MRRSDIYCSRPPVKPRLRDSNAACFESSGSRLVKIVGENVIEYPEYDGNSMYRTLGNIKRNPNVGLLFVKFDGKNRRIRINERASIHTEKEFLERHYGAKFVVRIEFELYPNCPRYIPNLTEKTSSSHVPRKDEAPPPPPEWKRRDYIREILLRDDPHRKEVWTRGPEES